MPTTVDVPADEVPARRLRGFGPLGIAAFVVVAIVGPLIENLLGGVLVLVWRSASRTPWRAIGYVRPASWARTIIIGVVFGVVFKLAMKIVVMPLMGAPPLNAAYHYLAGDPAGALTMAVYVIVAGGFSEETLYRGFLFERFGSLLGSSVPAKALILVVTSAWFAALHYPDQGVSGVQQAAVTGLVFGTIFARTGRIWIPMIAHAAFDLAAIAIIYWNFESPLAHLVFK
jgi:membrane protease YdiL (CAAX protease family)